MNRSFEPTGFGLCGAVLALGLALSACVPMTRPTLREARLGQGELVSDRGLRPGEIRGEIIEIQPSKQQIQVRTDDNRTRVLEYDEVGTRVLYHEREYSPRELQAGDVIAFRYRPRGGTDYIDTIRLQEPVQARAGSGIARRPLPPRNEFLEGTVERIDLDRGVFDVRQRNGDIVTVALPYNARPSEIETFRRLRRGDYVRLEGEFINRDNFQVLAFSR
ncbi:MAG TPA: hypothetical protein VNO43_10175 [Candidatus Eisenbacteria bacterium]|nr:hypothetical protein [Candidatus Eisenbacteria bacterium]